MSRVVNQITIVGASAGGLATAEALRRVGYGGAITLVGDEPQLPYDRPPLSKQLLAGQWTPGQLALRPEADIDALRLELRLGVPATGLDTALQVVKLADDTCVPYDALIVATGVRARCVPDADGVAGVHTLRTLPDALGLKERLRPGRHLVIVGAGFVGAEVAATARALGVEVTLLESGPVPLAPAVGEEAGRFLTGLHHEHGVHIHTGAAVTEIVRIGGGVAGVRLADGTVVPADDVLVAIGSVPNTEWLARSGLTVAGGLVCDAYCMAAPGVYGVGDVACWHNPLFGTAMRVEHRTNAAEQGLAVARNLLDPDHRRPFAPVPYFWSDQYDIKVQAYGHLRDHDEALVLDADLKGRQLLVAYRKNDRLVGVLAAGQTPKTLRAWRALIAVRTPWAAALTNTTAA
ncbi:NAD(P)/FAD-dependent oxidoreductase [Nonomuraea sp. NEAU-A123]|uniref:NAD(P)/FAD-dependent oxidoreductase n=1 Tax=Nonomuraea sp. NEAU-A123 TaxID=2839649 RepID=UPI001BE40E63|nr:FAD-dependent oxidoreductase [Nonomuraea sp. NEAU-A123]MBT2225050.1 NAD(P)/FAD-dependent oxidoreductase [Nonomuraea sp. NEAU-A123]